MMIDPANLKPSLVKVAGSVPFPPSDYEDFADVIAAFLNALLADDEAMERGADVIYDGRGPMRNLLRAAIIAAVTSD